jgi:hypothetical protein
VSFDSNISRNRANRVVATYFGTAVGRFDSSLMSGISQRLL